MRLPIIFVGMHRSGTSMLAGLLKKMGVFLGYGVQHNESIFFNQLNLYIERVCNCGWDNPEPIKYLYDSSPIRELVLKYLHKTLTGPEVSLYFGPLRWRKLIPKKIWPKCSLKSIDRPWGWKDPRNTFTAELWKELFPDAKFLHIYRNGVDVAASLRQREFDLLGKRPLDEPHSSPRCFSLQSAFDLWALYVEKAFSLTSEVGRNNILHIRYEDLLKNPLVILKEVVKFCDINVSEDSLVKNLTSIDSKRAYKFLEDKELKEFYLKVKDHPSMRRLGYSNIIL